MCYGFDVFYCLINTDGTSASATLCVDVYSNNGISDSDDKEEGEKFKHNARPIDTIEHFLRVGIGRDEQLEIMKRNGKK